MGVLYNLGCNLRGVNLQGVISGILQFVTRSLSGFLFLTATERSKSVESLSDRKLISLPQTISQLSIISFLLTSHVLCLDWLNHVANATSVPSPSVGDANGEVDYVLCFA